MSDEPAPTDADLMLLLGQTTHALANELAAGLECLGVSPRAHCVLSKAMVGEFTQGHLAELCDLDRTTMVATLDELEAAGLAERRPAPGDRRARIIAVTAAGERMVAEAQAIVDGIYGDVLGSLPARERAAFVAALERLVTGRLSEPAQCARPVRRRAERSRAAIA
jgi:MarR family transcriptional regulator for hemolysin